MTLRRTLLLIALAALALAMPALAERVAPMDCPTNPHFEAANALTISDLDDTAPAPEPMDAPKLFRAASAQLKVALTATRGDYFGEGITWTVSASGGSGSGYQYRYYVVQTDENSLELDPNGFQDWTDDAAYSYQFVVPGNYALLVYAKDSRGNSASLIRRFTVEDASRPTAAQRAAEIVEACEAAGCSGDYEKALWLHDWLTMNACYDYSYAYYSADGVLIRGTGVCDSYSKAYVLLLERAGIACGRVTGGNHAWNIVQLDGEWYQIDPTWDDPGQSTGAVSGFEQHLYFGLPDEVMTVDHDYTPGTPCVSYADNYFIRSGRVSLWTDELRQRILDGLSDGSYRYAIALPESYAIEREGYISRGKEHIVYSVASYALNRMEDMTYNALPLRVAVAYTVGSRAMPVTLRFDGYTLSLPSVLETIGSETFVGNETFMNVELQPGITAIGARAFAQCGNLWRAAIPASVQSIADDAFEGCTHLTLTAPEGSYAQAYAQRMGIAWEEG